jgi:soluble lytic murein transglycosylase-like protein
MTTKRAIVSACLKILVLSSVLLRALTAQTVPSTAAASKAAAQPAVDPSPMAASIEKQRASIQKQIGTGSSEADAFFSVAWTSPATIPVPEVVPQCGPIANDELATLVAGTAKTQGLQPELIRAVIRRESDSVPCATSVKGAMGLMQLMPEVAQQFGVADAFDPQQNVDAGSKYLKQLMTKYKGDLRLSLAAYNAGPQAVDAGNKVPAIPETVAYVEAILKDLNNSATPGH